MSQSAINPIDISPEFIRKRGKALRKVLLAHLSPRERKQIIETASLKERLAGLTLKERLAGLTFEEIVELRERMKAHLNALASKKSDGATAPVEIRHP